MSIKTPKPWPELMEPTPEQWLAWLRACTPDEQVEIAARVIANVDTALRCYLADHDNLQKQLRHTDELLQDAYRRGNRYRMAWHSARRRGWWLIRRHVEADANG